MMKKKFITNLLIYFVFVCSNSSSLADNHNVYELLELMQKDVRTLEKAVYSDQLNGKSNTKNLSNSLGQNSEEVLTRHLLKLSEIETQFQELTNKFEEINFKLDKLSSRLSKVQADNQLRFQQLEEEGIISNNGTTSLQKNKITVIQNDPHFSSST